MRAEHYWAIGSGVAITIALTAWLFIPHETTAKVASINWTYQSDLRQKTLMHDSGWGTPFGAFNTSCRRKHYGTEDCNPHRCNPYSVSYDCNCTTYDCNCARNCSNGNRECRRTCSTCRRCSRCSRTEYRTCYDRCDVYRDWCEYDYYSWPVVKTLATSGADHNEHWPDLVASGPEQRLDRTEKYRVVFTGKKEWTYAPNNIGEFRRFQANEMWKIKVNNLKIVTPLRVLRPEAEFIP